MTYPAVIIGKHQIDSQTRAALKTAGFAVTELELDTAATSIAQLQSLTPKLVIIDADASQAALEEIFKVTQLRGCKVLLVGGHSAQIRHSTLVTKGMAMYLRRPLDESYLLELFKDIYQNGNTANRAGKPNRKQRAVAMDQFGSIYGSSQPMREMYRFLLKAASSEAVLCICGESGTGKELVAEAVHAYSIHNGAPFEAINCAAIPAELVESELFGHEKGSFSGAVSAHTGIFERVGRGTLLLDEITEMPHAMQVKLLRVLESGRFRRVGGEVDHDYQARVIAATNRDPLQAVREGKLREDLFYRISQLEVRVPPLRERGMDIVELSRLFVARFDQENDRRLQLTKAAEEALEGQAWPGNVRQLWNVIQKACTTAREKIDAQDLPLGRPSAVPEEANSEITLAVGTPLDEVEEVLIKACLKKYAGDKQRTCAALGISLRTLYTRLEKYQHRSSSAVTNHRD